MMDLNLKLKAYAEQTKQLEVAYEHLQKQFFELKEKLNISHQTIEQIIAHMTEGLIFVSLGGQITLFNTAAAELLGCPCENVVHHLYSDLFSDSFFGFSMSKTLGNKTAHQRIFLTIDEDKEIEVSTSCIPEKGLLLLLRCRKEEEQLEKGLDQAERLKELGEMAATLAHEIRNPLGGIEGFAQLLKRDLEAPSHQKMIQAILEGTRTLNTLVTEVLDYARPLRLHFAPTDLVLLIDDTLKFARAAPTSSIYHFKSDLCAFEILLDQEHFKRALLNLLRNAFEAKATLISIELTQDKTLIVKDNGVGIHQKDLKRIFTPFFTTKAQGTGLGLAYSLAVIKAHGGTLNVTSEVGNGTQIMIKL